MISQAVDTLVQRARARLCSGLRFCAYAAVLAVAFEAWQDVLGPLYLYPVSRVTSTLLAAIGIAADLDASRLAAGLCVLTMERAVFHVTYECTGLWALLLYVAAVLAHPTTAVHRVRGIGVGILALFAYGVLRLVILGVIARLSPAHTQFFHIYLLVVMNVCFLVFLWASWARRAPLAPCR